MAKLMETRRFRFPEPAAPGAEGWRAKSRGEFFGWEIVGVFGGAGARRGDQRDTGAKGEGRDIAGGGVKNRRRKARHGG